MAVLGSDNLTHSTTFKFNINSADRIVIDANGNIGIGGVPATFIKFDVLGNQRILNQGDQSFLEIGLGTNSNQFAYIDLITDTTYTDYGLRIIRGDQGANSESSISHRGLGDLLIQTLEASPIKFHTNNTESAVIFSNGQTRLTKCNLQFIPNVICKTNNTGGLLLYGGPDTQGAGIELYGGASGVPSGAFVDCNLFNVRTQNGQNTRIAINTGGVCLVQSATPNLANVWVENTSTSFSSSSIQSSVARFNNVNYQMFTAYSSGFNDLEFNLRGDGNAFADGAWSGGGADYAEYFEWSDGNSDEEDRRGISVVLDGDKIREALPGEDPIGVISGNPSVVGDTAWNNWNEKYLCDDFGTYIREECEVEQEDGSIFIDNCRKLNPDYDPDVTYVPRENRPEWDAVGLMGKLRLRKGQVIGTRWVKMRDISDSVEEWLVR